MNVTHLLVGGAIALSVAACDDPAKDKARATVSTPTATASAAAAPANAATYAFSQDDAKIAFVGSKVTGHHDGSFKKLSGTVSLVDSDPTKSSVTVEIDATSLEADVEKLTGHLKSADFFDVEKFPKARFTSTSIQAGGEKGATHTITGNLELRGVTKQISFPAKIQVAPGAVDVNAEFAINRKDFGLNYPGKADDLIRDDVLVKLDVHAKPQKG